MKEIIRLGKDLIVPNKADMEIPQGTNIEILGQVTHQVKGLNKKVVDQKIGLETMVKVDGRMMNIWELEVVEKVCNVKMHQKLKIYYLIPASNFRLNFIWTTDELSKNYVAVAA